MRRATHRHAAAVANGTQSAVQLGSLLSSQLYNIIQVLESRRGKLRLPLRIALQDRDAVEIEFGDMLVEDQNNDTMSYADCENEQCW